MKRLIMVTMVIVILVFLIVWVVDNVSVAV